MLVQKPVLELETGLPARQALPRAQAEPRIPAQRPPARAMGATRLPRAMRPWIQSPHSKLQMPWM
jgi:hypothetical protein